jgi:hypothetical protein
MDGAYIAHAEMRNVYAASIVKHKRRRPLGRTGAGCCKMGLKEIRCVCEVDSAGSG